MAVTARVIRYSTIACLLPVGLAGCGGAAYQYFEEDTKGSIATGKQADLVVLEQDPMTADPAELEHIRVLETFSRGRSVYVRPGA